MRGRDEGKKRDRYVLPTHYMYVHVHVHTFSPTSKLHFLLHKGKHGYSW